MIRTLFTLIKIGIFVIIFLWLDHNSSRVEVYWQDYQVSTSLSVVFACISALFIIFYLILRLWKNIIHLPRTMQERTKIKAYKTGINAVYAMVENILLEGGNDSNHIVVAQRHGLNRRGIRRDKQGAGGCDDGAAGNAPSAGSLCGRPQYRPHHGDLVGIPG